MIKSLTLTVDEIRQLIEITDPEARRQLLQSLSDQPAGEINPDDYSDSHPMALKIARKIQRKEIATRRRREKRVLQAQSASVKETNSLVEQPTIEARKNDLITIDLNEATVCRLLWLKQNHALWLKAVKCIVAAINGSGIPARIAAQMLSGIDALFSYLNPLIRQAAEYHSTPRRFRPNIASNLNNNIC